jgi:hypothetical protein
VVGTVDVVAVVVAGVYVWVVCPKIDPSVGIIFPKFASNFVPLPKYVEIEMTKRKTPANTTMIKIRGLIAIK